MRKNGLSNSSNPCVSVACVVTLAVTITFSVTLAITIAVRLLYEFDFRVDFSHHSSRGITTGNGSCCDSRYDVGYERRTVRNRRSPRVYYEPTYSAYDYYPRARRARRPPPPPHVAGTGRKAREGVEVLRGDGVSALN